MMKKLILLYLIGVFACAQVVFAQVQTSLPLVVVLNADGPVTPAMAEYIERGIRVADRDDAELVVLALNTPGGSVDTMQDIVSMLRNSPVPVVVYVSPAGAMAGSAGTIITLAAHRAAMAPETMIGAASPVGGQGEDIGETLEAKLKEAMKAQVRSLASWRGEEAVLLAEATIEQAKAATVSEALAVNLVDYQAQDLEDLLEQLDGVVVEVAGEDVVLKTRNATITYVKPTLIEQLLHTLTNPNIVFILLTIGVQAVLIELSNPGGWVAGFIGVVCLSLAGYGLGALPVNWFGLIFLIVAFVLFVLDIKAPTHGALTAAGVGSLIVGALVLFNSPMTPHFQQVSVPLVILGSVFTGGLFAVALMFAIRAQRTPVRTGMESLIGKTGVVKQAIPENGTGLVQVASELWTACLSPDETPMEVGESIEVTGVEGIRLMVKRKRS